MTHNPRRLILVASCHVIVALMADKAKRPAFFGTLGLGLGLVALATALCLGACDDRKPLAAGGASAAGSGGDAGSRAGGGSAGADGAPNSGTRVSGTMAADAAQEATGGAAATTGAAGSTGAAGATTGAAGATTGAAGSTAGAAGATAGAAGATAGAVGSTAMTIDDGGIPACTSNTMLSKPMDATAFCKIFLSVCGTAHAGYPDVATCVATYSALTTTAPVRQQCQSYHLCNADHVANDDARILHCAHAAAEELCTQTH
jgi:hypothetical protein